MAVSITTIMPDRSIVHAASWKNVQLLQQPQSHMLEDGWTCIASGTLLT